MLACDPLVTIFDEVEDAEYYRAAELTSSPLSIDTLVVMTWNIKYGGGDIDFWWACYDDRVLMTEEEALANLEKLVAFINQVDPDILLLQEVDIASKRAGYVDQMQYLLDHTDLNYGVYGSMWRVQYAPSDGLGQADLGPAVLSRWPLKDAKRIELGQRTDQDALTTYFYIRRCALKARVELPGMAGQDFFAVTVHTTAWAQDDTKEKHIDRFKVELDKIAGDSGWFIAGGDLNTIPPGSHRLRDFPDAKCEGGDFEGDDYSEETEHLTDLYATYDSAVPLEEFQQTTDQSPYFTYGDKPDSLGFTRKLDYLFTNTIWVPGSTHTHVEIASGGTTLSDHAPISARLIPDALDTAF